MGFQILEEPLNLLVGVAPLPLHVILLETALHKKGRPFHPKGWKSLESSTERGLYRDHTVRCTELLHLFLHSTTTIIACPRLASEIQRWMCPKEHLSQ